MRAISCAGSFSELLGVVDPPGRLGGLVEDMELAILLDEDFKSDEIDCRFVVEGDEESSVGAAFESDFTNSGRCLGPPGGVCFKL